MAFENSQGNAARSEPLAAITAIINAKFIAATGVGTAREFEVASRGKSTIGQIPGPKRNMAISGKQLSQSGSDPSFAYCSLGRNIPIIAAVLGFAHLRRHHSRFSAPFPEFCK
ncbi:MAG: hypothetical protein EXS05_19085 [Planctomycetaceae bacterium]|nr:hypothetical protein [Planctomycetaceae bacterium]